MSKAIPIAVGVLLIASGGKVIAPILGAAIAVGSISYLVEKVTGFDTVSWLVKKFTEEKQ